ncbi:stress response protein NST1 [Nematostella vectensis]|uniref:stress response protein NST1 n=1 Tax=Nematostella vectensis TaxID=45351 RepID=UPI00207785BF|nr:stress response protein NST1 [Nematostella vectensis]
MVEMTDSTVLVERKTSYSEVLKQGPKKDNETNKQYLNGGVYFRRNERSNSECSSDSQLDNLLEAADRIKEGKNNKAKRRVHFNLSNNEEFSYSYSQYTELSDEEGSHTSHLSTNINFTSYYMNGHDDDSGDDDDDDYDDDDDDDEDDDNDYGTDTSEEGSNHGLGKYGYLVDKSGENRKDVNGNIGVVQNGDAVTDTSYEHQEIASKNEYNNKETGEKVSQVNQLESALSQRKNSVQRQLSDLSESLKKAREETNKEMEQLKKDLEARRHEYITDINNIHLQREEQKRKFEEELEEFQNEEKLEERRQRYHEHEALITKQELELEERKKQAIEQDREIRDYEEYLNRRHAVCNNKEKDLVELQNDLDTLSQELEAKRERLLNKSKALEQNMQQALEQEESGASAIPPPPLVERRSRSASRVSGLNRGTDMRIEELKYQNKQLLEELFTLKKAVEAGNEREAETHQTMEALAVENKRLTQKVKHLETQLELARKSADLASDSSGPSVDEILRKTTADMRNSRVGLRPSRMSIHSNNGSHARLAREPSKESVHSKGSGSSDSVKNSKSSKTSKSPARGNSKDGGETGNGRVTNGNEKVTSALCVVM